MANTHAVMSDMRRSMNRVERARPIIANLLNGGEIIPVEGDDNEVCKLLDMTCGTDYLQAYKDKGLVWGVASRIQTVKRGFKPYNTFTVRKARETGATTEYEKRAYAIKHGGVYPFLTMQAYVDENDDFCLSELREPQTLWSLSKKATHIKIIQANSKSGKLHFMSAGGTKW